MRNFLTRHAAWARSRPFLIGLIGLSVLTALYISGLGQPASLSEREYTAITAPIGPLNQPHGVVSMALASLHDGTATLRLPAVLGAMGAVCLLYAIVRRWHGRRIALMAAGLFATSGWLLHTGRSALPLILCSLVPLVLFMTGSWLNTTKRPGRTILLSAPLVGLLLYVPGAIWFVLVWLALLWPVIIGHLKAMPATQRLLAFALWLVSISGLIYGLIRMPGQLGAWLGLWNAWPEPSVLLRQWLQSGGFLVHGPLAADQWLGRAPLLDAFSLVCLALGMYTYIRHHANLRARLLAAFTVLASLAVALNGFSGLSYLLPMLYLLVAAGITFLLHEWYVRFPRNPLARGVGTAAVLIAVICAGTYHLSAYFVAWQRDPATAPAFTRQRP